MEEGACTYAPLWRNWAPTGLDSSIPPGVVFIPFCYAEAAANILTNPQLDPFGKIPEFKYCAAKIEPVAVKRCAAFTTKRQRANRAALQRPSQHIKILR